MAALAFESGFPFQPSLTRLRPTSDSVDHQRDPREPIMYFFVPFGPMENTHGALHGLVFHVRYSVLENFVG